MRLLFTLGIVASVLASLSTEVEAQNVPNMQGCGESTVWNVREDWAIADARTNAMNDAYTSCTKTGGFIVNGTFQDPVGWYCQTKNGQHKCSGCLRAYCKRSGS
jgi:hypothetical protein